MHTVASMLTRVRHREKSRIHNAVARYRNARRSLHTSTSRRSRFGLDWTNFFIADVQTGFVTFVAYNLAHLGWSERSVGVALTLSGVVGVMSQIPGGAFADAITWKRGLIAVGILMIGAASLLLALAPSRTLVWIAMLLHGTTAGIITPAIGAVSLGLVGRRASRYAPGATIATPPAATPRPPP